MRGQEAANPKEALRQAIEGITDQQAQDLLDYLNLQLDPDSLTDVELDQAREAEDAIARGEFTTLQDLRRELSQ